MSRDGHCEVRKGKEMGVMSYSPSHSGDGMDEMRGWGLGCVGCGFHSPSASLRIWDECGRGAGDGRGGKGTEKEGKGRENSGFESPSPSLPPVKKGVMGEQEKGLVERGEELGGFGSPSPSCRI